ncbi:signal peptide containing protein [Theileria equi strain WA]|uniref:Signal peptide containing protein n=1 Tax=Theileria equi strain WA TaxID=1537102 RepID=L1LAJ4_THEEQ|nr:signal peptide containing protein [Theileria equi strain WA]EKX72497.1 signal peptide containing protein [Theileria equi strain WA]|eukprot:XP_004831949.1 signal peptide containing protein [Theileria equi strain WA]
MATVFLIVLSYIILAYGERTTLDISKRDEAKIFFMEFNRTELSHTTYNPRHGVVICRIVSGNSLIWKQDQRNEQCVRFVVYRLYGMERVAYALISRDKLYYRYYRFKQGEWKELNSDVYNEVFARLLLEQKVNIRDIDPAMFSTHEYTPFGIPSFTYVPISKYRIATIADGSDLIWESEDHKCEYFVIHGDPKDPKLVQLFINCRNTYKLLYFERRDGQWVPVTKESFYSKLEELDNETGTVM